MKPLFFSSFYYVLLLTTHFSATPGPARPGPPGDLQRSSVDAGHHAVPEGPGFGAIVVGLHHDGLPLRPLRRKRVPSVKLLSWAFRG
jgi:hypothetical protein